MCEKNDKIDLTNCQRACNGDRNNHKDNTNRMKAVVIYEQITGSALIVIENNNDNTVSHSDNSKSSSDIANITYITVINILTLILCF